MSQKRVIRILSYEGNEDWMQATLTAPRSPFRSRNGKTGDTVFFPKGTIRELHRIELREGEDLGHALESLLAQIDGK